MKGFDADYVPLFRAGDRQLRPQPQRGDSRQPVHGQRRAELLAGVNGLSRGLYESPKRDFMPRFGFAYQATPKSIVRGGYGIFYGFLGERRGDVVQSGFTRQDALQPQRRQWLNIPGHAHQSIPHRDTGAFGASQGPMTFQGQAITFFDQKPTCSTQRWQLGLQREFRGFVAEAAYVGNRGTRIEMTRNLNTTPRAIPGHQRGTRPGRHRPPERQCAQPVRGHYPRRRHLRFHLQHDRPRAGRRDPIPQFDTVTSTPTYYGYSWYHGTLDAPGEAHVQGVHGRAPTIPTRSSCRRSESSEPLRRQTDGSDSDSGLPAPLLHERHPGSAVRPR